MGGLNAPMQQKQLLKNSPGFEEIEDKNEYFNKGN